MRRITLALALAGAVAATGCGQTAKPANTGGSKGIETQSFKLTVRGEKRLESGGKVYMLPEGGLVTGNGISCGYGASGVAQTVCEAQVLFGTPVALQVANFYPAAPAPGAYTVYGFAGACTGSSSGTGATACRIDAMNADRLVLVRFAFTQAGLGSHGPYQDPLVHGPAYVTAALACTQCHGATLGGAGLAPSCSSCHARPHAPGAGSYPAAQHGPDYFAYKAAAAEFQCTSCHGADLLGRNASPSCGTCHTAAVVSFLVTNTAAQAHLPAGANAAFTAMFASAANGPAVTAVCIQCHDTQVSDFMGTQHWTWTGSTPELFAVDGTFQATATARNPGDIGKANLINNFCVSVASNDKRCDQCHAGYGDNATNTSARAATLVTQKNRVDCLICHAKSVTGNMAAGGYNKIAGAFGMAGSAVGPGTVPAATQAQLQTWAGDLQLPSRENCGWCHFNGGGADSVKIMGTQLRNPAVTTDVHMSADTANGGQNMSCAACHSAGAHRIKGAGVHTPTNTARASCSDCHGDAPHVSATLNAHTATIACQTCHIPALSRQMPQKTDWDWSTAGAKQLGTGGTIYACVSGTAELPYDGNNCLTAGGAKVKKYDYMKGTFTWGQNIAPAYRWYNGSMTHVVTGDKGAFTVETGLSPASRITLSAPLGSRGDGKIAPFKVMTGRQAVYVDDANSGSFIITPNLFHDGADGTDGGFWGVLAAQTPGTCHLYTYLGAVTPDAFGAPDAPLAGSFVLNQTATPIAGCSVTFTGTSFGGYTVNPVGDQTVTYSIETLLAKAFTKGATLAGQVPAGTAQFVKFDGTNPGWDWRYTRMFLDLEHEVAPKAQALGAGGNCAACHGATPAIPICELYAGVPANELPWGVTCP